MHPHIQQLLQCINLEEKEQAQRYSLDQQHTLKQLKAEASIQTRLAFFMNNTYNTAVKKRFVS